MNLHKHRVFDRLNDLAEESRSRVQEMADDWRRQGRVAMRRAQRRLREGGEALVEAEQSVVQTVKTNPLAFALIGVAITSLIAAALLFETRRRD